MKIHRSEFLHIPRLRRQYPAADAIREAGECWRCCADTLYSFQLPGHGGICGGAETCRYFCSSCGLSAVGTRPRQVAS